MRNLFITVALFLLYAISFSEISLTNSVQNTIPDSLVDTAKIEDIFGCILEIEDELLPDRKAWLEFLQNNLQLDSLSVDTIPPGTFTVLVQFVINENGKLGEISIIKDPGFGLGKRVLNVLSGYKGHWKPAKQNNKLISSIRRQPITFTVEEECEDEVPTGLML